MKVSMLLLAAGRGHRFGGEVPKVFLDCAGRSVLHRSLERLAAITTDREIILAIHAADRQRFVDPDFDRLRSAGLDRLVEGGATRQQSMQRALAASDPQTNLVLIHDAARPLFPIAAARTALDRAAAVGAACLAIPVPDTLKRVTAARQVATTLDRQGVWLAQTPQVAQRALLEQALAEAARDGFEGTDDLALLERLGMTVEVVLSSPANLKITTPQDLALAVALASLEPPLPS